MKALFYALAATFVAFGTFSCQTYTEKAYTASGFNGRDAYDLGFQDGCSDRAAGKAHNPHINDPHETPASFRKDYMWGYTEGYRNPCGGYSSK